MQESPNSPASLGFAAFHQIHHKSTFQENVQGRIDQLTAQRETVLALVEQIPDGEARLVLQLRYGLLDNATKKTPWLDIPALMNYEMETIYRRHRKGIDFLNTLLESEVA